MSERRELHSPPTPPATTVTVIIFLTVNEFLTVKAQRLPIKKKAQFGYPYFWEFSAWHKRWGGINTHTPGFSLL